MATTPTSYRRHRFPPEIISYAVWLYHRFSLSFRDVEDLLAQRSVVMRGSVIHGTWTRSL
jgi:putative transposase